MLLPLLALATAASLAPFRAREQEIRSPTDGRSLVEHAYCSTAVLRNASAPPFDFDCLRDASSHLGSSVRVLAPPGTVHSAKACAKLCASTTYRGLPCRAYTWFSNAALGARQPFRHGCYGRTDLADETAVVAAARPCAGAVSAILNPRVPDCVTDAQCELNGVCRLESGTCACHPGWHGRWCQTLSLAPTPPDAGYRRHKYSSWGGSVVFDPTRQRWTMFAAEIDAHCGLNEWYLLSRIVRATAPRESPEGPYEFEAVVVDRLGHQPTVAYDPHSDHWLMYHQGYGHNCSVPPSKLVCRNGSTPGAAPDLKAPHRMPAHRSPHAPRRQGKDCMANFVMRASGKGAAGLGGKWGKQYEAGIPDNPTAVVLPNGTALLLGRGFGPNSNTTGFVSTITLSVSESGWKGPYNPLGPDSNSLFPDLPAPGWEDGFAWRRADGSFHAIFHGMTRQNLTWACAQDPPDVFPGCPRPLPCPQPTFHASPWVGRHAWSTDGVTWSYSPHAAFGSTVHYTDGSRESFARRERPHLILDDEGNPTHLVSGIQPGGVTGDYSFTMVQPTRYGAELK